ncbi:MAG: hypothetical protein KF794_11660 [Xanthobacteraceae bacterium]|nr:hypothetical protein [Xanthobacteraceae bacterium]QYK44424.1 MAG: hypothetical protein KF794_11660 [Xanthobacteraceae bacterium]
MRKRLTGLALAFLLLAGPESAPAFAQDQGWRTYANPRFGTTADYPSQIFSRREPPPTNGDGQAFTSTDGSARLSIYGSFNSTDDTPRSYVDNYVRPEGPLAYEHITGNFFAASGVRGDRIHYLRCNFGRGNPGIIHCFAIEYPAREKQRWDAIVTRISASLRAGPGIER